MTTPASRLTQFSPCRQYRYTLWREWDMTNPKYLMVIGLNPSTADETHDDPTIRKCIAFAKMFECGALCMTNLFAFRATDSRVMKQAPSPIGPENDHYLHAMAADASLIIAAWGNHGSHLKRSQQVTTMFPALQCLGRNQDGSPKHPLYLPYTSRWNLGPLVA